MPDFKVKSSSLLLCCVNFSVTPALASIPVACVWHGVLSVSIVVSVLVGCPSLVLEKRFDVDHSCLPCRLKT